jgi:hypothetical protein
MAFTSRDDQHMMFETLNVSLIHQLAPTPLQMKLKKLKEKTQVKEVEFTRVVSRRGFIEKVTHVHNPKTPPRVQRQSGNTGSKRNRSQSSPNHSEHPPSKRPCISGKVYIILASWEFNHSNSHRPRMTIFKSGRTNGENPTWSY